MAEDEHRNLEPPPRKSMEDPGAHDLEDSDSSDDHFSDAQSGPEHNSGEISPVPITRVEKVDNEPRYGELPGTEAYHTRENDAEPDEIAVIPDANQSIPSSNSENPSPTSAAAVPDVVVGFEEGSRSPRDLPIPTTKVEKVDSQPGHRDVPGTRAFELRKNDPQPDVVEEASDIAGSPTATESPTISHTRRKSSAAGKKGSQVEYNEAEDGSDGGFGDDFDDFEEGEEDAEFDDFDDGFQEAAAPLPTIQSLPVTPATPAFPILDFSELDSPEEIQIATEPYIDALFPLDTIDTSTLPPLTAENPIFLTSRSASLWSQLVAPPPLQPPNWIRSRIRRLFLVSLGVPVDLDEILPASKQKKLVLPSIHLNPSSEGARTSSDLRSISRLKQGDGNTSSTSVDSQGKSSRSGSRRRKAPPPVPQLDLVAARQLCTITDEALNGLTVEELREHVSRVQALQQTAVDVLEYWTKKTDEKLGDREAFEGVIENLVKHARKVRK